MLRLVLALLSPAARAYQPGSMILNTGLVCGQSQCSLTLIIIKIVEFLVTTATVVFTVLFLVGAFYMVLYAGKEDKVKAGKDIMIRSLIGLAIVQGSYAIVRTFLYTLALS